MIRTKMLFYLCKYLGGGGGVTMCLTFGVGSMFLQAAFDALVTTDGSLMARSIANFPPLGSSKMRIQVRPHVSFP